uniref:Uncharacterized protein n=1 Tax=Xenopus tropicalis TaxID=8364 RepID=A0A1B8XSP1_XENTR
MYWGGHGQRPLNGRGWSQVLSGCGRGRVFVEARLGGLLVIWYQGLGVPPLGRSAAYIHQCSAVQLVTRAYSLEALRGGIRSPFQGGAAEGALCHITAVLQIQTWFYCSAHSARTCTPCLSVSVPLCVPSWHICVCVWAPANLCQLLPQAPSSQFHPVNPPPHGNAQLYGVGALHLHGDPPWGAGHPPTCDPLWLLGPGPQLVLPLLTVISPPHAFGSSSYSIRHSISMPAMRNSPTFKSFEERVGSLKGRVSLGGGESGNFHSPDNNPQDSAPF